MQKTRTKKSHASVPLSREGGRGRAGEGGWRCPAGERKGWREVGQLGEGRGRAEKGV